MDTNGNLRVLLLKDLCCRLPYEVKVHIKGEYHKHHKVEEIDVTDGVIRFFENMHLCEEKIINCRLYLRPMSSMTEDEYKEMQMVLGGGEYAALMNKTLGLELWLESVDTDPTIWFDSLVDVQDWLNAHHFDYRGLIEKGLALEAPEGMYDNEQNK